MNNQTLFTTILVISFILITVQACSGVGEGATNIYHVELDRIVTKVDRSQIHKGTLNFGGIEREYSLFIPGDYTGEKDYSLVIYLHSYGSTPEMEMKYTMFNEVGNACGFFIAYPVGELNWNSGIADYSFYPTPDINDVGFIRALIKTLNRDYSIDANRIYAVGFSNGGFMAYKLACQLSDRIAAVAAVGGVLSNSVAADCDPHHAMSVLHIHGTKDVAIPIEGIEPDSLPSVDKTLDYWVKFNQCKKTKTVSLPDVDPDDGSTVEKTTYTNCTGGSDVVYYKVLNGGHTWPGGAVSSYGGLNQDFDASVAIWNFFSSHQLPRLGLEENLK